MNPQERDMLVNFLRQLTLARAGNKDPEAETLIRDAFARQPDAAYLLVQRAMQLEYALDAIKAEADRLKRELEQTRQSTSSSFINDPNAWGSKAAAVPPAQSVSVTGQPLPPPSVPNRGAAPAPVAGSSWGGGMLGNVAATAAGVVAGSFLFQGIQNLMGDHKPPASASSHDTHQAQESHGLVADNGLNELADADSYDVADSGFDDGGDIV